MFACFARRGSEADREPLLPQYDDDSSRQRILHKKLHTYQMIRALGRGYMPSNEQTIANLRSLLVLDLLNPENPSLSESGRLLIKHVKRLLKASITLLLHKNQDDELQDFIWQASQARVRVDVRDIAHQAGKAKAKADTAAVYQSIQSLGSLVLSNSEFRLFLADLTTIGRQVFRDTAIALSGAAEETGKRFAPSDNAVASLQESRANGANHESPSQTPVADDVGEKIIEVSKVFGDEAAQVIQQARESVVDNFSGAQKDKLVYRLKQAIIRLRKRPDYDDAVSTVSQLFKRWALIYSQALENAAGTLQSDVRQNSEADEAIKNAWSLLSSFGNKEEWHELEQAYQQVLSHKESDPDFENLVTELGNSLQKLLTEPSFLDSAGEKLDELRAKTEKVGTQSDFRADCDRLLEQGQRTLQSVLDDDDMAELVQESSNIANLLSTDGYLTTGLLHDFVNVFAPLVIDLIQVIPVPRLEVSTPDIDLLLENLLLTPGHSVNRSSFLPYRIGLSTLNDMVVRKTHTSQVVSSLSTKLSFELDGFSVRAEDVGFWLRVHKGLLRFTQSGLGSFAIDGQGIDVHVNVSIQHKSLDRMIALDGVTVQLHKFDFKLKSNIFSICAWLFKPILRLILRKTIEHQLASAITDLLHAANRELVFARERLRATRISEPRDVLTFIKAVIARLKPEDDPDLYTRIGFDQPGHGVFAGRYAPGSLAQLWVEQGRRAGEHVDDGAETNGIKNESWRNDIFDIHS